MSFSRIKNKIALLMDAHKKSEKPSLLLAFTEAGRALTEFGLTYPYEKIRKYDTETDGHPVMILPGFMGSKFSTGLLRDFVQKLGYSVYDWGLGRNMGKVEYMDALLAKVAEIQAHHNQKVSLIGWSLGGVFAREIAKARPDLVRQVITLGSPFQDIKQPNNATWLYSLVSGGKRVEDNSADFLNSLPLPAPVPTTAIYSKDDGIVPWQVCMELEEDDIHQNIQVRGSHCGLGVNASVFAIISNRLKYSKENWRYFKPQNIVSELLFYPS